jgi:hypothetical protein
LDRPFDFFRDAVIRHFGDSTTKWILQECVGGLYTGWVPAEGVEWFNRQWIQHS